MADKCGYPADTLRAVFHLILAPLQPVAQEGTVMHGVLATIILKKHKGIIFIIEYYYRLIKYLWNMFQLF